MRLMRSLEEWLLGWDPRRLDQGAIATDRVYVTGRSWPLVF